MSEWEAVGATVRTRRNADGTGGYLVAECSQFDSERTRNARLIAAAPLMLTALKLVDQADGLADSHADYTAKMTIALRAVRFAIDTALFGNTQAVIREMARDGAAA